MPRNFGTNRNVSSYKTSKYRGVSKNGKGWCAQYNNKYLGQFKTQELAAKAYDQHILLTAPALDFLLNFKPEKN